MSLEIPAAQVPFIKKYFELLKDMAEETPPGQNLRIDRDILSTLTDEQLEGFKRLVAYFHDEFTNNQRNEVASEESLGLRNYYRHKNTHNNAKLEKYDEIFSDLTEEERTEKLYLFEKICKLLHRFELDDPAAIQHIIHLIPGFTSMGLLWGQLTLMDINQIQGLGKLFNHIAGTRHITTKQAETIGQILQEICISSLDSDDLSETLEERYRSRNFYLRMKNAAGLKDNNLRTMVNYLGFQPTSGGKRKGRKTRKQRKH